MIGESVLARYAVAEERLDAIEKRVTILENADR